MSRFSLIVSDLAASLALEPKFSRGFMLDVEDREDPTLKTLVLRGCDKAVIGQTKTPDNAAKVWNDETGARHAIPLATGEAEALATVASEIIAFYSPADGVSYATRIGAIGDDARQVLTVLLPMFGAAPMNRNGWYVGAMADAKRKGDEKARKELEKLAKTLQNADTLRILAGAQASAGLAGTGAPDIAALFASLVSSLTGAGAK